MIRLFGILLMLPFLVSNVVFCLMYLFKGIPPANPDSIYFLEFINTVLFIVGAIILWQSIFGDLPKI